MANSKSKLRHHNFQDLTGQRFDRLIVIGFTGKNATGKSSWQCQCDCGHKIIAIACNLKRGHTRSCGCFRRETITKIKTTHGHSNKISEYFTWINMRSRCENPNSGRYQHYGERGILVCERWHKFENFLGDMGRKPTPKHSIERKDNDGNYEPSNCRWGTQKEQSRNKSNSHWITYCGETLTIAGWADKLGIGQGTIGNRIRRGWSVERTLTTKIKDKTK